MTTTPAAGAGVADQEIADRITNALILKNITARHVAHETGMSYSTLRNSLKGRRSLRFQEFTAIAAVIGVDPAALVPDYFTRDAA